MAWMYILECSDGSYYVGSTSDLERRIWEHNEGLGAKYTARRRPVRLVYAAEFESIAEAYEREKQVQGWGRPKRQALIDGDYGALPELARIGNRLVSIRFATKWRSYSTGARPGELTGCRHSQGGLCIECGARLGDSSPPGVAVALLDAGCQPALRGLDRAGDCGRD